MTTHDQHTYPDSAEFEAPSQEADPAGDELTAPQSEPAVASAEPSVERAQPSSEQPVREATETASERALFADDEMAGLRARWDNVQAGFVDDPRDCVQKADGLVSDVVKQLTAGFSDARTRLEEQWARGEEASTEDLRVALKQYREFFQRLLAV